MKKQTSKQKKKQHYLNRAPGSVLPGRCQEFADVFHLFVCQRRPAEVAGSGGAGEPRVASLFFFSFFQEMPQRIQKKKARRRESRILGVHLQSYNIPLQSFRSIYLQYTKKFRLSTK